MNENLAREILELHTLGGDGGYSQQDVTTFAKVISGWSIGGREDRSSPGDPGAFRFRPMLHEPGAKTLLGRRFNQDGFEQGRAVMEELARRPATARHLAAKLARHFVADDPPAALVQRLSATYLRSGGRLSSVYEELVAAEEAWVPQASKYLAPQDFIYGALRALDVLPHEPRALIAPFQMLGQPTYRPGSPAGWPDRSQDWDGADALMKRIEWSVALAQRLGDSRDVLATLDVALGPLAGEALRTALARADSVPQGITMLLMSPEFQRR
ncbi:MAG: DUF1800 family protein [Gammaproteobacteria bacterium]|nr:DUF1800 family protein [Gammaproteobacteria bacterium]